ncbi:MAG: hypothetical protein EBU67_10765 [Actinobacteria bacterium]|nr:hypothetical protein [Actinomycetota bacterium]
MTRPRKRLAAFVAGVACAVLLTSCRVDSIVSITVERDGSGTVDVVVTADSDIVKQVPRLSTDLDFSDMVAAGWKLTGPEATEDGGLRVLLSHPFDNETQASALLAQINGSRGPFRDVRITREGKSRDSVWKLTGRLEVTGGLQAFADDQLLQVVGATPYEETVKEAGLDLGKAISLQVNAKLPGKVQSTTGAAQDGVLTWRVATDGTPVDLSTTTNEVDVAGTIGGILSFVARALLFLWLAFIGWVGFRVWRRQSRRPRYVEVDE